jgi:predicted ATPase
VPEKRDASVAPTPRKTELPLRDEDNERDPMFVMISGCSGGGKSTLLSELAGRGYTVVEEPGRRILAEERARDGSALPWVDAAAFGRRALAMSVADHEVAQGLTFFDRGVVDAGVAIIARGGELPTAAIASNRYDRLFLAPPWPEIYEKDADRQHSPETALRDYERVRLAYVDAGYDPVLLPRDTVAARAEFVLTYLLD